MAPLSFNQITALLNELRTGDKAAESELISLVYPELRRIAAVYMRRERGDHTLQPTALVHEAYLRLAGEREQPWANRAHFFAAAARVMRQVLVDHARKHRSQRRGGGVRVELQDSLALTEENWDLVLDLDRALEQLSEWDSRQADVVVLRYFGGLTEEEIGEVLQVSSRSVKRDWQMARAWLQKVLAKRGGQDDT